MDFKDHASRGLIKYLNIILALQSLALLFFLLFDISKSKNNYFLWYSKQRLILILVFFLITALLVGFFLIQSRAKEKINRILTTFVNGNYLTVLVIFFSIILLSIIILYSIPKNIIQYEYLVYYDRLQPVLLFISFSIIETIIALYLFRNNKSIHLSFKTIFKSRITLIFILTFLFFFVIVVTGLGNQPDPLSWRQLGSPLLTWQIIFSVFIGLIYGIFESKFEILKKPKYVDLILVIGIFIIAVSSLVKLTTSKGVYCPARSTPKHGSISIFRCPFLQFVRRKCVVRLWHIWIYGCPAAIVHYWISLYFRIGIRWLHPNNRITNTCPCFNPDTTISNR